MLLAEGTPLTLFGESRHFLKNDLFRAFHTIHCTIPSNFPSGSFHIPIAKGDSMEPRDEPPDPNHVKAGEPPHGPPREASRLPKSKPPRWSVETILILAFVPPLIYALGGCLIGGAMVKPGMAGGMGAEGPIGFVFGGVIGLLAAFMFLGVYFLSRGTHRHTSRASAKSSIWYWILAVVLPPICGIGGYFLGFAFAPRGGMMPVMLGGTGFIFPLIFCLSGVLPPK
jgi:hypothetical protein